MQKITGLVLAGGRSSRMGTNKALLEINGETLLNRAVRLLELSGCKEVFISGDYYGQRSVPDRAQLGPLAGIAAGLDVCKTEKLLILPVDMPYMTSELLQLLMRFTFAGNGISYADAQFPLLLLNNDVNREILAGLLAPETPANQRSMHQFCHAALIIELPISPKYQYCFENTNTPEEWQLCQRRLNETVPKVIGVAARRQESESP